MTTGPNRLHLAWRRNRLAAGVAAMIAGLALAACNGSGSGGDTAAPATTGAVPATVGADDNILATDMTGDSRATGYWNDVQTLFGKFGGATIPYASWDPATTAIADQNAGLQALVSTRGPLGIYWDAHDNGDHKSTWIYAHGISASYRWLLSQTRQNENARGKLNLKGSYADGLGTDGYNSVLY